ncbi:MAG: DUF2892 domain-containing protein [Anaerolineae bacterium]|jgi:hypothetical protein|nr:DUF2892 domain-containing protein [Anaerolineae bacterium]
MDGFLNFLASRNGRITRLVIGVILLVIGLAIGFSGGSLFGWILAVIGLFPVIGGALDLCLLAPFFGKPLKGAEIRAGGPVPPAEE